MDFKELRVSSGLGFKDLAIVGEMHLYGDKESKWASELLKSRGFDYGFFEEANIGRFLAQLLTILSRPLQIITRRDKKTLRELAVEKGIPIISLEKGTVVPIKTQIGLSILILLFILYATSYILSGFVVSVFTHNWWLLAEMLKNIMLSIVLIISLAFIILKYINNQFLSKLTSYFVPNITKERDKIMSDNLINYIKEREFKSALVVVGKAHFQPIVTAVQTNFECTTSYGFRR